jgi:peptidyl-prolyl cis-trans isomerase B (cyclophilin B)
MKKMTIISSLILCVLFNVGCRTKIEDPVVNETPTAIVEEAASTQTTMKIIPESGDTIAIMKTNHGEISILLYTEKAPETTKNFIELANDEKYDNTIFHRVIEDFMIQGGDFTNHNGTGGHSYNGPGTSIDDEFSEGLTHLKGALSMANAGPDTGGSQFFIVQAEEGTSFLDGKHAIFGFTYDGLDIIDKIAGLETLSQDKPEEDVTIESITIGTYE